MSAVLALSWERWPAVDWANGGRVASTFMAATFSLDHKVFQRTFWWNTKPCYIQYIITKQTSHTEQINGKFPFLILFGLPEAKWGGTNLRGFPKLKNRVERVIRQMRDLWIGLDFNQQYKNFLRRAKDFPWGQRAKSVQERHRVESLNPLRYYQRVRRRSIRLLWSFKSGKGLHRTRFW
jgi:hypothetical protein